MCNDARESSSSPLVRIGRSPEAGGPASELRSRDGAGAEHANAFTVRGGAPKPIALIIIKRLSVFFLSIACIALFFWYAGSFQSFLDATLIMLVRILKFSALGMIGSGGLGIAVSVLYALLRRYSLRLGGLAAYAILLLFAAACLILADGLILLHSGMPA
ncbi:MAG TPA: hypothetical protein VMC79_10525 [Rectinemataceae bacterium]|nr:hypothetical protein [Rectinemataceae bacterium]